MPKVTVIAGLVLIALGLLGYFVFGGDDPHITALIPAFVGVPIALLGLVAFSSGARKHAMHVAAVLAVLGFLAPLGRLIPKATSGELEANPATFINVGMSATCLVLVLLCIRSFIAARKASKSQAGV